MPGNIVRFFFGAHASVDDARAVQEDFDWCTVFCPEATGASLGVLLEFRQLARGNLEPHDLLLTIAGPGLPFDLAEMDMIYGSGKRIELVDEPPTPLTYRLLRLASVLDGIAFSGLDYESTAGVAARLLDAFAVANRERDRGILARVFALDEACTNERILVRLGASHCRVALSAAATGMTVERAFQKVRFPISSLCVYYRYLERDIPRQLLARYLLGETLKRFWFDGSDPGYVETELWRVTSQFDEAGIRKLWDATRGLDERAIRSAIRDALHTRGASAESA